MVHTMHIGMPLHKLENVSDLSCSELIRTACCKFSDGSLSQNPQVGLGTSQYVVPPRTK